MKRIILVLSMLALATTVYSEPEKDAYIPKNLDECYVELTKMLSQDELVEFKSKTEDALADYHFGLGREIRNKWQLWGKSELKRYLEGLGVHHPDNMSGVIILSFHRHLNGKEIKLDEQISHIQTCEEEINKNGSDKDQFSNIDFPIIKHELNGMTDDEINEYFNRCVSSDLLFLYRGGFTGWYLVEDIKDYFVEDFRWVGIGCTGGVEEGYKFNKLILEYIDERLKSNDRKLIFGLMMDLALKVEKNNEGELLKLIKNKATGKEIIPALKAAKIKETYNVSRVQILSPTYVGIDYHSDYFTNKPLGDTFIIKLQKVKDEWTIDDIVLVD